MSVIIEHGEHGSSAAAPVAGTLVKKYLGLLEPELAADAVPEG
jgi:penicillin-binding protein 2